jgi:signal transduction histidine kinase
MVNREYERCVGLQRDNILGKTDFEILPRDVAEAIRANDLNVVKSGVPIHFEEIVPSNVDNRYYVTAKFLLRDSSGKPYALCGIATEITALKRAEELEKKMARERESLARQRAMQLAKANEALRGSLDALATVPELDLFLGRVMAAISGQLGAPTAGLRLHNTGTDSWTMELVFKNGRVMSAAEAGFPESVRSQREIQISSFLKSVGVYRMGEPQSAIFDRLRDYFLSLGVKTLLTIPLFSREKAIGLLTLAFAEDREFRTEELEIATALATQASLGIQLAKLADAARESAVLQERNRLAGEIHDSLAQSFTGISMQLGMAQELLLDKNDNALSYVRRADDLARFGLAEARRSTLSLHSAMVQD